MTCYKPLIRVADLTKWETAKDGHRFHPAKVISTDRLENYWQTFSMGHYKYEQINCGNCIGCRIDKSREWANRGYLESLYYNQNYFVTLTYDDNHKPYVDEITTSEGITYTDQDGIEWNGILKLEDLQNFMKRLRSKMARKYKQKTRIRMMACGEYGTEKQRPHYHLIIFNLQLPADSFYNPRVNWENNIYYQNKIIEECWTDGISNIAEANWETMAYTARYITKKINGNQSEDLYAMKGQRKEFFVASNRPGIANKYYEQNKEKIYKNDQIMIQNNKGVHYVKPPDYFDKLYKAENPKAYEQLQKRRKKENLDKLKLKQQQTSLTTWEQLQVEEETKKQKTSALKRNFEREL